MDGLLLSVTVLFQTVMQHDVAWCIFLKCKDIWVKLNFKLKYFIFTFTFI